jgi:NAD(P)-dependent dehydrogenase (short-subunit alcohol dehydrogenase family)
MEGKVVVVTGANSGIGKVTARELARLGAQVVLAARDEGRGLAARDEVRRVTGNDGVELVLGDFARLGDVRSMAEQILTRWHRLDVLVNNAGLVLGERRLTADGFEATFQINHLAPFLLTHLLLPRLRSSAPARIVNVASEAHRFGGPLEFDDLQAERGYIGLRVYGRSKLANVLFTGELARRLAGSGVTANCLHPGVIRSGFAADGDTGVVFSLAMAVARPFMLSPEKGARTSIYLASSPEVETVTGQYFHRCRPCRAAPFADDEAAARRLWAVSETLLGLEGRSELEVGAGPQ